MFQRESKLHDGRNRVGQTFLNFYISRDERLNMRIPATEKS